EIGYLTERRIPPILRAGRRKPPAQRRTNTYHGCYHQGSPVLYQQHPIAGSPRGRSNALSGEVCSVGISVPSALADRADRIPDWPNHRVAVSELYSIRRD